MIDLQYWLGLSIFYCVAAVLTLLYVFWPDIKRVLRGVRLWLHYWGYTRWKYGPYTMDEDAEWDRDEATR
jgi:hypothetical protein